MGTGTKFALTAVYVAGLVLLGLYLRDTSYATRGGKVPCDVPSRELIFARALNKACEKVDKGHEAQCMAKLIEEAIDESNKSCK